LPKVASSSASVGQDSRRRYVVSLGRSPYTRRASTAKAAAYTSGSAGSCVVSQGRSVVACQVIGCQ
jgi:hypothetical protein